MWKLPLRRLGVSLFLRLDKIFPMERIDWLVDVLRRRSAFEIPPAGDRFTPIRDRP